MVRKPTPLVISEGDKRISELEERTALLLTDMMTLVAGGVNYRSPLSALLEMLLGNVETVPPMENVHFYSTAGVAVWTKPVSEKYVGSFVGVIGPGGPGGGITGAADPDVWAIAGAGGGGGGGALGYYPSAELGTSENMTISAATIGPPDGSVIGTQGTATFFTTNGVSLVATGGNPGASAIAQSTAVLYLGGTGGTGGGSPLGPWAELRGSAGGIAIYNAAVTDVISGFGGGAPFFAGSAGGGGPELDTAVVGTDGFSPGQGGAGACGRGLLSGAVAKGGDGSPGFGFVVDLYSITG
jgi:hypothetical protein